MSFRITTQTDRDVPTILVEGRLSSDALPELRREVQLAGSSVRIDLSGLMSADADVLRELLELTAKGAILCGESAYIRQRLDEASG